MKKIIVIGSGICGLTAAYRLKTLGFSPIVVEREARVGGRTITDEVDGFTLDLGGTLLATTYKEAFQLIDELGLKDMQEPSEVSAQIYMKGRFHPMNFSSPAGLLRAPFLSWRSKLSLLRLVVPMLKAWKKLNLTDLSSCAELDNETAESFCRRTLTPEAYDLLVNNYTRYMYGHDCADISVVELLWILKIYGGCDAIALKGGIRTLTSALSKGQEILTQHQVQRIDETGRGVVVHLESLGRAFTLSADYCVVACDGKDLQRIYGHALSDAQNLFLSELRYNPYWIPTFKLKERPPIGALMTLIPGTEDTDIAGFYCNHLWGHSKVPAGKGLMQLIGTNSWNFRMQDKADKEACLAEGRRQLQKYFPSVIGLELDVELTPWARATLFARPGHYKRLKPFVADMKREARVQYGGDYMSQSSIGTAVATGSELAKKVLHAIQCEDKLHANAAHNA